MNKLYLSSWEVPARPGYIPSLDGLRAISISLVLLAHFVDSRIFPGGLGVYIFFVISGFLITHLLLAEHKRTGTISLRQFYTRRIIRLYPVIVIFTAIVICLDITLRRSYNMLEPASAEVDPIECFEVIEVLASLDGAVCWCALVSSSIARFCGLLAVEPMRRIVPTGANFAGSGGGKPNEPVTPGTGTAGASTAIGRWRASPDTARLRPCSVSSMRTASREQRRVAARLSV
jgi:Acyltransferase family